MKFDSKSRKDSKKHKGKSRKIERRLLYLITERVFTAKICRMGDRFYIQLPKRDNALWEELWKHNIELNIYLKWSWPEKDEEEREIEK